MDNVKSLMMATNPPLPYSVYKKMEEDERFEAFRQIADSAKAQASAALQQVDIMNEQLSFAKAEAESAKKDALFSKTVSIVALIISIVSIILPQPWKNVLMLFITEPILVTAIAIIR